jgi:hypothetical protein
VPYGKPDRGPARKGEPSRIGTNSPDFEKAKDRFTTENTEDTEKRQKERRRVEGQKFKGGKIENPHPKKPSNLSSSP